ncbi:MAG: phospholipase A [Cellvibrio sp.]|uniref:phospholipase A n=1 Tax=Cellvibrio sp. TaxID=1965322 RepID=UPI00272799C1|nr:phospholipase A [Cellvibrio sp.]
MRQLCLTGLFLSLTSSALAADTVTPTIELSTEAMNHCLQASVVGAAESMTVAELKQACLLLHEQRQGVIESPVAEEKKATSRVLQKRMTLEALNRSSRFVLTPHKRNYLFPLSFTEHPNSGPYQRENDSPLLDLSKTEVDFQLSIKILLREDLFGDNGHLYLGYTNHSLWQVYSDKDSAPFRETDHQPELILSFSNDWEILGFRNALNEIALNHQSNGQGGLLSRSWNRVTLNTVFERGNFAFALNPWYRIPEPEQEYPGDPDGDDNPDITDYMGNFELNGAYQRSDDIYSFMLRNNLDADNKGAVELGWSFPISSNLRGQLKYFNGYGYSLIDYNADMEVFALGIVFTDLF